MRLALAFACMCVLALVPAMVAAVPIPYSNCATPAAHVRITTAEADVWPPVSGRPLTITLGGVLDEQVDSGNYAFQVLYNSFPIISKKGPLSDLPNVTFPIAAGPIEIVRTLTLPSIGKAAITVNASATDQKGEQLLCIGFTMNLNANPAEKGLLTPDQLWDAIQPEKRSATEAKAEEKEGEGEAEAEGEALEDDEEASLFDSEERLVAVRPRPRARARPSLKAALSNLLRFAADEVTRFADSLSDKDAAEAEAAEAESVVNVPFTNCGSTASDLMSVQSVTSSVWPPVAGSTAALAATVMVNQQVNGGAYVALLSVDGLQVVNSTGSIESFAPLPLMKGPMLLTKNVTLPASMPFSGTIGVELSAANDMAQQLFCIAFSFAV